MEENATQVRDPLAALYASLAKAQGEFQPLAKNREVEITMKSGGKFKFRYADLEAALACTRPALAKHGLAVIQTISGKELITQLVHADGGWISSSIDMPANTGGDIKSYGATITYLRRYAYCALLCVAADDDLDENGEAAGEQPPQQTNQQKPARTGLPPYTDEQLQKNLADWRTAVADKRTTPERIIKMIQSKAVLNDEQIKTINALTEASA
ncbi:ERF superfamily protein [compost metagenome]